VAGASTQRPTVVGRVPAWRWHGFTEARRPDLVQSVQLLPRYCHPCLGPGLQLHCPANHAQPGRNRRPHAEQLFAGGPRGARPQQATYRAHWLDGDARPPPRAVILWNKTEADGRRGKEWPQTSSHVWHGLCIGKHDVAMLTHAVAVRGVCCDAEIVPMCACVRWARRRALTQRPCVTDSWKPWTVCAEASTCSTACGKLVWWRDAVVSWSNRRCTCTREHSRRLHPLAHKLLRARNLPRSEERQLMRWDPGKSHARPHALHLTMRCFGDTHATYPSSE
jgi:hypothetical protein